MIDDPLFYLVVEKIKQLSNSETDLEDLDCQLNSLDYVLFDKTKSTRNSYDHDNYLHRLINCYLNFTQEDYHNIGIEANIWFFNLISDIVIGRDTDLLNSKNIGKLANLYVTFEHPYCKYLVMTIYSNLSVRNRDLRLDDFVDNIWRCYKNLKINRRFKNHDNYNRNESLESQDENSEYNEILERHLLTKEIETIIEDINIKRRKEDY
jgi:hypothetical protein